MYKCRHCGAKISRLNKDTCPLCGGAFPLQGGEDETEDLTKSLEKIEVEEIKQKTKSTALVLAILLGMFGINEYYLGYKKAGIIVTSITVVLIAALKRKGTSAERTSIFI